MQFTPPITLIPILLPVFLELISRHLLVPTKQWKHMKNIKNLRKVDYKEQIK